MRRRSFLQIAAAAIITPALDWRPRHQDLIDAWRRVAEAITFEWKGDASSGRYAPNDRWNDPRNWEPYGVPIDGDSIVVRCGTPDLHLPKMQLETVTLYGGELACGVTYPAWSHT